MSIAPSTDILLDMARAADPARARAASAKLNGGGEGFDFTEALDGLSKPLAGEHAPGGRGGLGSTLQSALMDSTSARNAQGRGGNGKLSPYSELEAVVLQQCVELILPQSDTVYGGGYAGGVWRSMLAEHMARNVVKAGGIGLARKLEAAHPPSTKTPPIPSGSES